MIKYNRMADSVAASQLLKALTTLQEYSQHQEEELSFAHEPSQSHQDKHMNFEIYMQKKGHQNKSTSRKSVTPLKNLTRQINNLSQVSEISRSNLSPLIKQSNLSSKKILLKQNVGRDTEKENKLKDSMNLEQCKMNSSKLSVNTRKILGEKEKRGSAYVPIQLRAEELLKERGMKLAKLQRQKEMLKVLQQKQCTFKPNISRTHYKGETKKNTQSHQLEKNEVQVVKNTDYILNENNKEECLVSESKQISKQLEISEVSGNEWAEETIKIESEETAEPIKVQGVTFKKYKNEKFNNLLDFLH